MNIEYNCRDLDDTLEFSEGIRLYRRIVKSGAIDDSFKTVKIALLTNATLDQFAVLLRLYLLQHKINAEIWISEFDAIEQSLFNEKSSLYTFHPDIVWFFVDERLIFGMEEVVSPKDQEIIAAEFVGRFQSLWEIAKQKLGAYVIQNNLIGRVEREFGNHSFVCGYSRLLSRCNVLLSDLGCSGVGVFDIDYISSLFGKQRWHDERLWLSAKVPFDLNLAPAIARRAASFIAAQQGKARKVVVLDLDNTLWGGVIGDDGIENIRVGYGPEGEAYIQFQKYLLALNRRGILLAVCSKNDESNARLPFEKLPEMILRMSDFAAFHANWDNKADNIMKISNELNLGLDSFVFVDDNPVERKLIRDYLPDVAVPELPSDPALYVRCLDEQAYFETVSYSPEDSHRTEMYKENRARSLLKSSVVDLDEYLRSLDMRAKVEILSRGSLARASQLICKSNQFHLTTTRYSEVELENLASQSGNRCFTFRLRDRFGDNGLVSVVLLKRDGKWLLVDTWVMSCRVLGRGLEQFIFQRIVSEARNAGLVGVRGVYIPTKKNGLVKNLYRELGCEEVMDGDGSCDVYIYPSASVDSLLHHIGEDDIEACCPSHVVEKL